MQLAVADVDRDHTGDAVLKKVIGEPAGGGADVDRFAAVELDVELLERVCELLATARDEARRSSTASSLSSGTWWPGLS